MHGYFVHTEHTETASVSCGTSCTSVVSTSVTSVEVQKRAIKNKLFTHAESHASMQVFRKHTDSTHSNSIDKTYYYYVCGVEDAWAVQIVIATTPKPLDDDQNNYARQRLGRINMDFFLLTPK